MNSHAGDPKELGTFLRARRAELAPHQVGLPATGTPRRVTGLRREEVAQLAAISTDYYTRVEQGRMSASAPVLEALARVLRLSADQRTYLLGLAGRTPTDPPAPATATTRVTELGHRLLAQLTTYPALVLTDAMDVLAWNPLAATLLTDFALRPEHQRNYVWLLFNDPALRARYCDWDSGARSCVAYLRMNTAGRADDPRLRGLLTQMAGQADFQRWWQGHEVAVQGAGNKHFRHPLVGDLTLDWDTLTSSTAPDQHIVVWTAQPGSPSEQRLHELAAAVATHGPTAGLRDGQPVAPGLE
ncbi:helix-turn-helix domain-containing protein [Streptomyces sp. NRRL WC-3742]|uniref:helix-turn-helix domain-containing protein n=1 Tax=Streptomyces sp. NRRL WC-3742 TaxID=1463934 RepID=UPI00068B72D3|nr:helix-turn-helix domain-containing protein [Streptomyces sp. NRRL WC-3742]